MELQFDKNTDKETVIKAVEDYTANHGLKIANKDAGRPWGGFLVVDKDSTDKFIDTFFPDVDKENLYQYGKELSPKILIVAPGQKLSWQYHHRRAELWKCIAGPVGLMVSDSDEIPDFQDTLNKDQLVQHANQVRHRLVGLDNWGVLAEIWQHTDPNQPSDEADIVRLEDEYGRN